MRTGLAPFGTHLALMVCLVHVVSEINFAGWGP